MYQKILELYNGIPTLESSRLTLRRMLAKDYLDMYEYASNPIVSQYLLWNPHDSPSFTKKYLKQMQREYEAGHFYDWALERKSDGKMIGTCGFTVFSERHNFVELGYVLNPSCWNMGYTTEAVSRVIAFSFEELDVERIEARHMDGNWASGKVMMKCGMQKEGVLRNAVRKNDFYKTVYLYSILKEHYFHVDETT
jgi:ribosomal-protein-alanine N-acetyltransferase